MQVIKLADQSPKEVINQAIEVLGRGGLVIYPTETVYGVGVDATSTEAVEKLLAYKSRREGKPLSIAVADQQMAAEFVELNEQAEKLYQRFLPGPYTIVSRGKGVVAPGVESEFGTLGTRIPDYPLVLELVKKFGKPITATSANASGKKRPYTVQDVLDNLSAKQQSLIDLIIDAGELPRNEPSTVIDTTLSTPLTVRGQFAEGGQQFTTHSDQETRDLAGKLVLKNWNQIKEQGLLIALNGELGAGKTVFTQGVAKFLQINEPISSPTYSYMDEYDYQRHGVEGKLHHLDMWKVDSQEIFEQLGVSKLIKPNNVVVIEWWQQIANYWDLKPDLLINLEEIEENSRQITVEEKHG